MSSSEERTYRFILQFKGYEYDREFFDERLNKLKETEALVYRDPTPLEAEIYSRECAQAHDYAVNSIVMIITVARALAEIAQCIHEFLKDKSKNSVFVKMDSREVEVTGELSKEEIIEIIREGAKITTYEEAYKWIQYQRNTLEIARAEVIDELKSIENITSKYVGMTEVFEKDSDRLKPWQVKRYKEYKKKLKIFQDAVKKLRSTRSIDRRVFRYFRRAHLFSDYTVIPQTCDLCGHVRPGYTGGFYGTREVKFLCEECLAAGRLAEIDAKTNQGDEVALLEQLREKHPELDEAKIEALARKRTEELIYRTPCPLTWQDFSWPTHCGDYCCFVKEVGKSERVGS